MAAIAVATTNLELVTEYLQLAELRKEWCELAMQLEQLTPFQLPEWLLTWWPHFGSGQLQTLIFRKAGQMIGILPCFRHAWKEQRQLTLVGSGISDYLEPAIKYEYREEVVGWVANFLRSETDWDICNWQDLSADTPLQNLAHFGLDLEKLPETDCSEISLRGTFEGFWERRPHGLRRNFRRYSDKARTIDTPLFRVSTGSDPEALEALIELHARRWQRQGEAGIIVANKSANFLRDVVAQFAGRDMLRFFSLRFQGTIAAVILAFPFRNKLYSYLSAFDPEYEHLSFGTVLLHDSLKYAFECGYESWNFLRGRERYKFDWGAEVIHKTRLLIKRTAQT
jgi:CelD/BcsL family acetyltransferase involved in cellulose biosynthesis